MAITLHDFETTLGTHNRGNIQLGDEPNATLKVVNNHLWKTGLNNVQSDPESNRRVRTALLAALTGDGRLSAEYVKGVRAELLGEGHATADLTRVELKTLLDAHKVAAAVGEKMKAVFQESTDGLAFPVTSDVFDNMTTRAALQATEIFSAKALVKILPPNLPAEILQKLELDAGNAELALTEIYALKGADLVADDPNHAIENGIKTTVDRLMTLAEDLREVYNADAVPENRAFLEEMIHYASARASEIQNVYYAARDLMDKGEADPVRNAKSLRALVGEETLKLHGTDDFLQIVHTAVKPLFAELATLRATPPDAKIPAGRLMALVADLKRARAVVGHATTDGIAWTADEGAVFLPDKSLTKALEKTLDEAIADAEKLVSANARRAVRSLLDGIFNVNLVTEAKFGPVYVNQYRTLMRTYVKWIRERLLEAKTPDLSVFDTISLDLSSRSVRGPIFGFAPESVQSIKTLVATMLKSGGATEIPRQEVEALLKGEIGVGSLVGARTYGFDVSLVDPKVDDRFVTGEKSFGKGNVNEVTRLVYTYPDGTTAVRVFKPEVNAMEGMRHLHLGKGYPDTMQIARINAANRKAAELLGIPEVAVRVTVGMHKGVFGFFMDEAPGATGYEATNAKGDGAGKSGPAGLFSYDKFPTLSAPDQVKALSPVFKGLTDLEWLDWLTGQMDRHGDNYKIVVNDDFTGSVKGIDNDGAFPVYRTGLYTYRFNVPGAERSLLDALGLKRREDLLAKFPNKARVENNVLVVDCEDDAALTYAVWQVFGINSSNKPLAVSEEFHAKLLSIDNPEQWVEDLLGEHFTAVQKEATVLRLKEMIAYAKTLDPATQVLSKEGWKDPAKISAHYQRLVQRANPLAHGIRSNMKKRNLFELQVDYWVRDFLRKAPYQPKKI